MAESEEDAFAEGGEGGGGGDFGMDSRGNWGWRAGWRRWSEGSLFGLRRLGCGRSGGITIPR